jgi:hypothetical protein
MFSRVLKIAATTLPLCGPLFAHAAAPQASVPAVQAQTRRVLIASESSTFKDRLATTLSARLVDRKLEVQVIDIAGLADVDSAAWLSIVLVHNWEFGEPPTAVRDFLARTADPRGIIDVTTSSNGLEKPTGVDVVTSASVLDEIPELVTRIDAKIGERLKGN